MDLKLVLEELWSLRKYIPISLLLSFLVGVIKLLLGWNKYKKEIKLNHSKDLIKELKMVSKVVFSKDDKTDLKLFVEPESDIPLDNKSYSEEVNAHLEDSVYKDIRELIDRRDFYINKLHNTELQEFLNELNLKIMRELTQKIPNIPEWDEFSGQPKPKKYYTKYLKSEIGVRIQFYYENYYGKRDLLSLNIQKNGVWNELRITNLLVSSDDYAEIQEIKKMIEKNFNIAINSGCFKILKHYLDNIIKYHNCIEKELNKLMGDVDSGTPLKGHCNKCPIGDSLWQYTKKYLLSNVT